MIARHEIASLSKLSVRYAAIPYVAALLVSLALIWLGLELAVFLQREKTPTLLIMGAILAASGAVLAFLALLALWILKFEVLAFAKSDEGDLILERRDLAPLTKVTSISKLTSIQCIFRPGAPRHGCVKYVILKTNKGLAPMPFALYEILDRLQSRRV